MYATDNTFGGLRWAPADVPTVENFADSGVKMAVHFGAVPESVRNAAAVARAWGRAALEGMFGTTQFPEGRDRYVQRLAEECLGDGFLADRNWYVTVCAEAAIDLPTEAFTANATLIWLDLDRLIRLAREYRTRWTEAIDAVASCVALGLGGQYLGEIVWDRVVLVAPGRRPLAVPEFSAGAARASTGRPADAFTADSIRELMNITGALSETQAQHLKKLTRFYSAALVETDPLKAFLWYSLTLERLVNSVNETIAESVLRQLYLVSPESGSLTDTNSAVRELLLPSDRRPPVAKFAVLALAWTPQTASNDVAVFRRIKAARDDLAHGVSGPELEPPTHDARSLVDRYLQLALRDGRIL